MWVLLMTLMMVSESEQPAVALTRAEEHRIARESKAHDVRAPQRNFLEAGLHEIKERRIIERFNAGFYDFHPRLGSMRSGSGFSLGTSYSKGVFEASAQVSFKGYQRYQVRLSAPPALNERLFAGVRAEYRNFSQEKFFGVGNDSRKAARSDYRFEDHTFAGELGFRLADKIKVGGDVAWIETRIAEGTGAAVPPLSEASFAAGLPAFETQPRYLKTGAFLDIDTRDEPGNPRRGTRYAAEWASYHDQNLDSHGFNRVDIEVQRYFPFFNERRVIALRAKTALTHTADGQQVPFYMLPAMGGADDLRGFSEFRFRDKHLVVVNAEYRWEAFSGLDMALFADAGQVASRVADFDFGAMKTAGGIGFRFNTARKVFCRVDLGFSEEGPRVFLNFGHVF